MVGSYIVDLEAIAAGYPAWQAEQAKKAAERQTAAGSELAHARSSSTEARATARSALHATSSPPRRVAIPSGRDTTLVGGSGVTADNRARIGSDKHINATDAEAATEAKDVSSSSLAFSTAGDGVGGTGSSAQAHFMSQVAAPITTRQGGKVYVVKGATLSPQVLQRVQQQYGGAINATGLVSGRAASAVGSGGASTTRSGTYRLGAPTRGQTRAR